MKIKQSWFFQKPKKKPPIICNLKISIAIIFTSLILFSSVSYAQTQRVNGLVTDKDGEPLIGVTVIEKGTTNGVVTNVDGKYTIDIKTPSSALIFSYIGYKTSTINLQNQSTLNAILEIDILGLDEVVVVGYGTTGKRELTGSVGQLNVNEIDSKTFTSIDRAMQGKIPGVSVQTDGSPGGRVDIRVRGLGTITNNEPLLIVDGVPVENLNAIDPSIIQSVNVLKDASATAIYGNRASNGVVLIKTKKGQINQRAKIQANYQFGVSTLGNKIELLDASQYKDIMNEAVNNAVAQGILASGAVTDNTNNFIPENNDWQDEISQTALSHVGSISGTGGTENLSYYLSTNFRRMEGVIKGSAQDRVSFTANTEFQLTDKVTFGENLTFIYQSLNNVNTHSQDGWGGIIKEAVEATPQIPLNVNAGPNMGPLGKEIQFYGNGNPVFATLGENLNTSLRSFGNAYLNFNLLKGLDFKTQLGFNYSMVNQYSFSPYRYFPVPELSNGISERFSTGQTVLWDNFLTYDTQIGMNSINIMLGSSVENHEGKNFSASRDDLLNESPSFRYMDFGSPIVTQNSGSGFKTSLQSYFARVNYNYDNKYLATATIRADGSSRFMKNNQWGYFPSLGVGWNISEEDFIVEAEKIDFLKMRASYGQVGNQSIGSYYPYLDLIEPKLNQYVLGPGDGSVVNGTAESSRGNQDITWETTTMLNVGVDVSLFGKLSITAEYYNNNTKDLLLPVQLADIGGFAAPPYVNIGTVNSRGLETSLDYYIVKNRDWNIQAGLNGTYLKNKVTDLGETDFLIGGAAFNRIILASNSPLRTTVGQPISSFFGYEMEGIFQNQDEINNSPKQEDNTAPGDIKWVDQNNDGVINSDDRIYLGDGFPDFVYGLNFSASYKDFDFSVTANGVLGAQIFNALRMDLMSSLPINKHVDILDRWRGEGTSNKIPRVVYNDPAHNVRASDYFIESGNYLRLSTIQLGYTLPNHFLNNLSSVRAYVTIQNLHTFTSYSGSNPEVRAASNDTFQRDLNLGWDTGVYPVPRSFLIGLDITF